jgi:hypothetical protein
MTTPPDDKPIYRLLTGKDDRAFCERVSEALEQGWQLYGSPAMSWDSEGGTMKVAQAVVWPDVVKEKGQS